MRKKPENESAVSTVDKAEPVGSLSVVASQANLARDERRAALRALAGRLAHQIRNPLAAVRAACSSLHEEIDDADQRETLQLTLNSDQEKDQLSRGYLDEMSAQKDRAA